MRGISENHEVITFVDTPGHATFSRMRMNGCFVADIVILIIAADEGIQSQTLECFNIIQEWKVPVVVAINKIDLEEAKPDKVISDLKKHKEAPLSFIKGIVPISVKESKNIDLLLKTIDLVALDLNLLKGFFFCLFI